MQYTPMSLDEYSPNLDLGLLMPAQAQKHVTVNESFMRLDALAQSVVLSRTRAQQPAEPLNGQAWIVPINAQGAEWGSFQVGSLAIFRDGFWTEMRPKQGWRTFILEERQLACFTDAGWRLGAAVQRVAEGDLGAATDAVIIETRTDVSGTTLMTDAVIPARAVVFCVSVRTLDTITGAARFDCGLTGETAKFGGSLSIHAGAENLGVIAPTAFYADTPIVLTAGGGPFTGGRVGLAIHAWMPRAMPAGA